MDTAAVLAMSGKNDTTRRGGAYVLVLITCTIVTALALSALAVRGAMHRSAVTAAEISRATHLAQSGLEVMLQRMNTNPSWRKAMTHGEWTEEVEVAGGRLSMQVRDPADSDLDDSETDPVIVRSVGVVGSARQIVEAELTNLEVPLTSLHVAAWARLGVTFSTLTVVNEQIISTNATAHNNGTIVLGTVEAANFTTGGLPPGWNKSTLATPRDRPPASAFDYYLANGTAINYGSLPSVGSARVLRDVVLSPTSNPFGPANPRGIYVINCQNSPIIVRDLRVVGTLVLINLPTSGSAIDGTVSFEQAVPGFPVLMAEGNLSIQFDGQGLLGVLLGAVPSRIRGPAYVSGNVTIPSSNPVIEGSLLVGGTLTISGAPTFRHVNLYTPPPPGLSKPSPNNEMRVVAGSIQRILE